MSSGVQTNPWFVKRCITLYWLMKKHRESWVWLEGKLDEKFPKEHQRRLRRSTAKPKELFINSGTIRQWVKNPQSVLKGKCSNLREVGGSPAQEKWNQGVCIHMYGVASLEGWFFWKATGNFPADFSYDKRKRLKPGRRPQHRIID